jgi:hypothetical protein
LEESQNPHPFVSGRERERAGVPGNLLVDFEVENVGDLEVRTIQENQMAADHKVGVIRRRRRKHYLEFLRTRPHLPAEVHGQKSANYQLTLQAGREPVALGQAWREMRVVIVVPGSGGIAIVIGIAVAIATMAVLTGMGILAVTIAVVVPVVATVVIAIVAVMFLVIALVVLREGDGGGKRQRKDCCGSGSKPGFG